MRLTLIAAFAFLAVTSSGQAQTPAEGWRLSQLTLYGWIPGITGAQEYPDGEPILDLDSGDVLDALDFAFFGSGEVRRGQIGLMFDFAYADLEKDGVARAAIIPGADPAEASAETQILMATGAVAYRFHESAGAWADVYAGLRAYDVEADVTFRIPAMNFEAQRSVSSTWVDGIVGLRGYAPLNDRFSVTGLFDVGGFGIGSSSDLSWQVLGTVNYAFTDRVIGRLGYRYMSIDRDSSDLTMDIDISGPVIGVTWTF